MLPPPAKVKERIEIEVEQRIWQLRKSRDIAFSQYHVN